MLTEIQFKGLYTGRLAYVEYPDIVGFQIFGIVFIKFKHEIDAVQRVRLITLLQRVKNENVAFSLVLVFPDEVEFSGIDMNTFKDINILLIGFGSHLSMVCGIRAAQKLQDFGRTKNIQVVSTISEALMKTKLNNINECNTKMTKNIIVLNSDSQQRNSIVTALLIDRFSTFGVASTAECEEIIGKFGKLLDGAVLEFTYPSYAEVAIVEHLKKLNSNSKILIHCDVLDPKIIEICQKNKITSVLKSPFQVPNLLRKYKTDFPEREANYLGFSE
jgi:hypothetical protein